jgi:hypothetical protein
MILDIFNMSQTIVFLCLATIILLTFQHSESMWFAASQRGQCVEKKGSGLIKMKKDECTKIGGKVGRIHKSQQWADCYLDWCNIPNSGAVSHSTAYTICKQDEQSLHTYLHTPIESFRPYGTMKMRSGDCQTLNGWMGGKPGINQWVDCYLKWCPNAGSNRNGMQGVLMSQTNECGSSKLAYGSMVLNNKDCSRMGGETSGRHVIGNSPVNCVFDLCEAYY